MSKNGKKQPKGNPTFNEEVEKEVLEGVMKEDITTSRGIRLLRVLKWKKPPKNLHTGKNN